MRNRRPRPDKPAQTGYLSDEESERILLELFELIKEDLVQMKKDVQEQTTPQAENTGVPQGDWSKLRIRYADLVALDGRGQKLEGKQEQAIAALVTHRTVKAAAKAIGVGESTLRRWLKEPLFHLTYERARQEVVVEAIYCLEQSTMEAASTLREILNNTEYRPMERIAASRAIFELSLKGSSLLQFEERMTAVERWTKRAWE